MSTILRILGALAVLALGGLFLSKSVCNLALDLDGQLGGYLRAEEQWNGSTWTSIPSPYQVTRLVAELAGTFSFSWVNGFILGRVWKRGIWFTGIVFYLVVNNAYLILIGSVRWGSSHAPPPFWFVADMILPRWNSTLFVFVLPILWGINRGFRQTKYQNYGRVNDTELEIP